MNSSRDKTIFTTENLGRWFGLLRNTYQQNLERLNKLDGEIGDGDHGFTMLRAFQAAEKALVEEIPDLGTGFEMVSTALAENAGGAIGPILAAFFGEGKLRFSGRKAVNLADAAEFFQAGLAAVQEIGGAQPGEKTLVDALAPAVKVLAAAENQSTREVIEEALQAAQDGAAATRELVAARGRSRFTAERSLGHPDPGAVSITLLLEALLDFIKGENAPEPVPADKDLTPPPGKFINHPDQIVPEDNLGLALAYPELVRLTDDGILVRSAEKAAGKTALVIGHGGGHTPSMGGLVGPGLLDADVYGPVFTCASGMRIARAVEHGERGGGTVLLVSNHSGDVLNARLAVRLAREKGIEVETVLLGDDIATAPRERLEDRRGLGGLLFALKTGGAAAEQGASLSEVAGVMRETNRRTVSLAVAVRPPTHPATGEKMFELEHGQIEIGTGVHGEVGVYRGDHLFADQIISLLLERLLKDLSGFQTNQLLVFLNGSGGTSLTELHILYQSVYRQLLEQGFDPAACVVDSLFTTGEMGGFSLSLCAVDSELMKLWQQPAAGPSFHWPRELTGRR